MAVGQKSKSAQKSASQARVAPAKSARPVAPTATKKAVPPKKAAPPGPLQKAKAALKKVTPEPLAAVPEKIPAPKVSKAKSRKISVEVSAGEAASALAQKWVSLNKKADQFEAQPYNMKQTFEEKTAIVHKVLGWGYILANRNDRLEVLFKDGIKYLISNYKP